MPRGSVIHRGSMAIPNSVAILHGSVASTTVLKNMDFTVPPFCFIVLACASTLQDESILTEVAILSTGGDSIITTNSFDIIGIEDEQKKKSEKIASLFTFCKILYIPGGYFKRRIQR